MEIILLNFKQFRYGKTIILCNISESNRTLVLNSTIFHLKRGYRNIKSSNILNTASQLFSTLLYSSDKSFRLISIEKKSFEKFFFFIVIYNIKVFKSPAMQVSSTVAILLRNLCFILRMHCTTITRFLVRDFHIIALVLY